VEEEKEEERKKKEEADVSHDEKPSLKSEKKDDDEDDNNFKKPIDAGSTSLEGDQTGSGNLPSGGSGLSQSSDGEPKGEGGPADTVTHATQDIDEMEEKTKEAGSTSLEGNSFN